MNIYTFSNTLTLSVLLSHVLIGCTANHAARQLARETMVETVSYEDSLRKSSRILNEYYVKRMNAFEKNIGVQMIVDDEASRSRMASDAADRAIREGFRADEFRSFIYRSIEESRQKQLQIEKTLSEIKEKMKVIMVDIEQQEQKLKAVRTKLEGLQVEPDWQEGFQQFQPLFNILFEMLNNQKGGPAS